MEVLWRGLSYSDILRVEKHEIESRVKDEVREEIEVKKAGVN